MLSPHIFQVVPIDSQRGGQPKLGSEGQARARYSFTAQTPVELSLRKGEEEAPEPLCHVAGLRFTSVMLYRRHIGISLYRWILFLNPVHSAFCNPSAFGRPVSTG